MTVGLRDRRSTCLSYWALKMKKPANFDVQPAEQSRELWFFPLPTSRPAARTFIHAVLESAFDCNRKMHRKIACEAALAFLLCHCYRHNN